MVLFMQSISLLLSIRNTIKMASFTAFLAIVATYLAPQAAFGQQAADQVQPEEQTSLSDTANKKTATGTNWIISVANPHAAKAGAAVLRACLLYTSPSPRDLSTSRMPSSA